MANRFFTHIATLDAGQTARANQVNAQLDSIDSGFEAAANELNRCFRFTDGTPAEADFQLSENAAARAGKVLGFDSSGDPSLLSGTFTFRGAWQTATQYSVNDVVVGPAANNSSLYICTVGHTSGTFATDLSASRWTVIVDLTTLEQNLIRHQIITNAESPFAASAGDDLMVDVSGGAVTVNLPASPSITDAPINILHVAGDLSTNTLTIGRNGKLIMAIAQDMTVDIDNASFGLAFANDTLGWRLRLV